MPDSFPDNWTYLRTELTWLDRVLAGAIARQRKERKAVERVSQARVDQITSHWWQGLIQLEGDISGDSPADVPRRSQLKGNYQQHMESRIQASQQKGITLGLPALCQKLELSLFEKNAVLLALAPEVNRRYGKIYNFLQETEHPGASGLPTIDLMLRLLCRNDGEWRSARLALSQQSKLVQYGVVVLPQATAASFLSRPVKVADAIAEYLLADAPQPATLDQLLPLSVTPPAQERGLVTLPATWQPAPLPPAASDQVLAAITCWGAAADQLWDKLVLPDALRAKLQHLGDRARQAQVVQATWALSSHPAAEALRCGTIALLVGAVGTGKTLAARAIAQSLQVPLTQVDLALLAPAQYDALLHYLDAQSPAVLLVQSAQYWLGRSSCLAAVTLRQFLQKRQHQSTLTFLSVEQAHWVKPSWQPWLTVALTFPLPDKASRLQIWQQAFPPAAKLAATIDWQDLGQLRITGGMIQAIAQEAAIYAAAEVIDQAGEISMKHIRQACEFLNIKRSIKY